MVRLFALALLVVASVAHAETRHSLRVGVLPLDLQASPDTPWFGDDVGRVVKRFNSAAADLERETGAKMPRIDASDLGVAETLFVLAPGVEIGGDGAYFLRIEAPIGLGSELRSFGVGFYPLNLQTRLRGSVFGYASLGGTASWLDRSGPGDVGGLVTLRAAVGARFAKRWLVELGYHAVALGGTVNRDRIDSEMFTREDVEEPDHTIAAGEARGIFDVSVGVSF
jgi:hypothetical protein